jgi:hypothetical protein
VLVTVTVIELLSDDTEFVVMLVALIEVEVIGSTLLTTLVAEVDDALSVAESRLE